MLEVIEQDLVMRLAEALPELHVEAFPDDPKRYRLQHAKGAVLVIYRAGRFASPMTGGAVVQDVRLDWEINLLVRSLRGHDGVYGVLDVARRALVGWRPTGCAPCWLIQDGFVSQGRGVWQYALRIATRRVYVQDVADEELPVVTHLTFEGTHGTTEVPHEAA